MRCHEPGLLALLWHFYLLASSTHLQPTVLLLAYFSSAFLQPVSPTITLNKSRLNYG